MSCLSQCVFLSLTVSLFRLSHHLSLSLSYLFLSLYSLSLVSLSLHLSVCPSLTLCLCLSLSICLYRFPRRSFCLCLSLSVCLSVCLSLSLSTPVLHHLLPTATPNRRANLNIVITLFIVAENWPLCTRICLALQTLAERSLGHSEQAPSILLNILVACVNLSRAWRRDAWKQNALDDFLERTRERAIVSQTNTGTGE